jgi:hypothetical protein
MAIRTFVKLGDNNEVTEWKVAYENRVLYDGERNFHDDSDFYAIVWDDELGEMRNICYASTRGWSYPNNATVDFGPNREGCAEAYAAMVKVLREKLGAEARAALLVKRENPDVGDEVRVVHGPGLDTVGTVFWAGYGRGGRGELRVGVSASGEKVNGKYPDAVWTLMTNVDKTLVELTPEDEERIANVPDERFVATAINAARGGHGCIVI